MEFASAARGWADLAGSAHSILVQRQAFIAGVGKAVFRLRILESCSDSKAWDTGVVASFSAWIISAAECGVACVAPVGRIDPDRTLRCDEPEF